MRLRNVIRSILLLSALGGGRAIAQTCSYDFHQDFEQLTRLTDEFNPLRGHGDSKTELIREGYTASTDQRRETYYVARDIACVGGYNNRCCPSGTDMFFRTFNASLLDYRDSPVQNDAPGYVTDALLGCPYTSRVRSGLSVMARYFKSSITDYKTWLSNSTPPGYALDVAWSINGPTPRIGYQRFGNLLDRDSVFAVAFDAAHTLDNGVLKLEFNKIWGDAIGMITFEPTNTKVEYYDPTNPGASSPMEDMVQTVVRWDPNDAACRNPNPTQSGGADGALFSDTTRWAGSPIVSEATAGTDQRTLTSVVRPLNSTHSAVGGTGTTPWLGGVDAFSPLAWQGWIKRSDTLGCRLGAVPRRDIVETSSALQLAEGYGGPLPRSLAQTNSYWLAELPIGDIVANPAGIVFEWVDYTTVPATVTPFTISPTGPYASRILPCAPAGDCGSQAFTPPAAGKSYALVVSRQDGTLGYAVAMKAQSPSDGLDLTFHCPGPCSSPGAISIVFHSGRPDATVTTGSWSLSVDTYLIVNNHTAIMTRLNELASNSSDCAHPALNFYTVTPCRLVDTRNPGQTPLVSGSTRIFQMTGICGIPATAKALAINSTLANSTSHLELQLFPGDQSGPPTIAATATPPGHSPRATSSIIALASNGTGTIIATPAFSPAGQSDLIIDVTGYYDF